jgi:phosphoglycerol transferase MdoB-like AlkP superfamily enzyme
MLAFLSGLWRDVLAGVWLTLPVFFWLAIVPGRWQTAKWHRFLFWAACVVFWFGQAFLLFAEYFFFDEFRSRFNTVAVDYLQYPKEVFVNIWDSYHVGLILLVCLIPAVGWVMIARKLFSGMWTPQVAGPTRGLRFCAIVALVVFLIPICLIGGSLAGVLSSPIHPKGAHISNDRTLNEIANNGNLAFLAAALTHHLDYSAFYKTLDRAEAYQRVRRLLNQPGNHFVDRPDSIERKLAGDPNRQRLNVVILLEESFGSEFWGSLGRTNTLTPEMDKLAAQEGMLFTNIYASGNRTVRGMEGILSSFPPLPGDSIVKRDLSDNVETIAKVLQRDGYSTLFLYGGRGVFDGMRSFAIRNGYDRFVEQKHFESPRFTTIWGVCDEDLYQRSVSEFRDLAKTGKPFFATVLSVSNHKPYTYPRNTIPEDPDDRRRENAVKYCDYALGKFFEAARKESFWTNTIFVVVADHGARVYGEQSIPIHSYEIPLLIAGPAVVKGPTRAGTLGCSLDVAPTVLGLIGRPYESTFFGQDLLQCRAEEGRACLNHNRDIGMLSGDRLVVLGLMQGEEFYSGNPKLAEMKPLPSPAAADRELEKDAIALFQVADDLYMHQRYRLRAAVPGNSSP